MEREPDWFYEYEQERARHERIGKRIEHEYDLADEEWKEIQADLYKRANNRNV